MTAIRLKPMPAVYASKILRTTAACASFTTKVSPTFDPTARGVFE